ncbi:MAG: hydroxymethylbilane synthase [Actinobacteria bacterium]|nr:MAG: hydroxymethylbilane synthase [Actinomycetota bacterium]
MKLRIGTRRSRLAMAQAEEVAYHLALLSVEAELVPMVTSGDRGGPAGTTGGVKASFVAEIVQALREGRVDLAVHSAKDLPAHDLNDVTVAAVPERSDPFDVLVTREANLGPGAVVGTSSLRRQAQLLRSRPHLEVRPLRGNVDTRLSKLESGVVDGLVLAAAGLARLGISPRHAVPLPLDEMVPAPGQGALAVQARTGDDGTLEAAARLNHPRSRVAFEAERGLVRLLGGDCSLPLGAYAEQRESAVRLMAVVIRPDGADLAWAQVEAASPEQAAQEAAQTLLAGGAGAILAEAANRS